MDDPTACIAFAGTECLALGPPGEVAAAVWRHLQTPATVPVCVLDARTSEPLDFLMDSPEPEVAARAERQMAARQRQGAAYRRGRPRLGGEAREITLLARHWDWLDAQPGGAAAALRRLVEAARKQDDGRAATHRRREAVHRFLLAVAGDLPGYEEAERALWAGERAQLEEILTGWPPDVAAHARRLLGPSGES
jgi:hypothetical protein